MKAEAAEARVRARIADAVVFIFIVVLESSIDQIYENDCSPSLCQAIFVV